MANPYQAPEADPELGDEMAPPAFLESFQDPLPQTRLVILVCAMQAILMVVMALMEAPPVRDFGGQTLLGWSMPFLLASLVAFSRVTTPNAKLFRVDSLEASRYWPLWLVLPVAGAGMAYWELRKVARASGAGSAERFAVPWLLGLTVFFAAQLLPFGVHRFGLFFLFIGQACLAFLVKSLRDAQVRLVRLAAVAQVLLDAEAENA
ncbi:MAG: hypothetical protein KC492_26715 [Myxococcales bacterium]|nr:hypothetical protein [Myxococcales bacterium]